MSDRIPITKPWLGAEEAQAAADAVLSGWVAQGPRVARFEDEFAARVEASNAVAVSSCTTGLHLVLHALGVGAGDEVIVPSLSFIATANVVVHAGARPVFADVSDHSQNICPVAVEALVGPRTRAVIAAHQVGEPANIEALAALCDRRGLSLIEDAACGIGSTIRGRPVGAGSSLAVFSFHPRKILTTGEGGMITCDDPALAERLRRLRNHSMSRSASERTAADPLRVHYAEVGYNYRMTDIQAAVGSAQLAKLDEMLTRRREQAARYERLITERALPVALPPVPPWGTCSFQSYTLKLRQTSAVYRDAVVRSMQASGVSAIPGIAAAHRENAHASTASLPHTDAWADRSLMLPVFHELRASQQERVVAALAEALAG